MPQGPGDDILDAIESGASDDVLTKKYKLGTDQVKAFKTLYNGLINRKLGYNEIGDYFPELKTYFAPSAPTAPTAPAPAPQIDRLKKSSEYIKQTLNENDDVVDKVIRQGRYRQDAERRLNEYAQSAKSDMPAAATLALERLRVSEPETKPQDLPVTPEDIAKEKAGIQSDEQQARHFLTQVIKNKPEKATEIQRSVYELDAAQRADESPETFEKVKQNLEKLEKGELKYDPKTGRLIQEEGFFDALVSGVKERNRQLDRYKVYQGDNKNIINILEADRAAYDPDKPVPVPKGVGELTNMAGMEWASLLKGAAVGATVGRIAPQAAPFVTAAISSPEYYKRGYTTALEETYNQLRNEGKDPEQALKTAQEQAKTEGNLSAAEGVVSSVIGSRIGLKPLPKYNITGGFKSAAAQLLKQTTRYAAGQSIEAVADGLVASYLQEEKNKAAERRGIFREDASQLKENFVGEITFSLALGGITKAGEALGNPKLYKKLLYWLGKQPPEAVDAKLTEMVSDGQISEEDAQDARDKVKEQRDLDKTVPENIKDVSRMAMADKIARRQELEKQLESVDKALHPPIKEEIKKLNEEILEHSKHVKPETDQADEAEASEQQADAAVSSEQAPSVEQTGLEAQPAPGAINAELFDTLEELKQKAAEAKSNKVKSKAQQKLNDAVASMPESARLVFDNYDEIESQLKANKLLTIDCG